MTTPLTSDEIREWTIARYSHRAESEYQVGYQDALDDLVAYIDNEPKLREIMNERTS